MPSTKAWIGAAAVAALFVGAGARAAPQIPPPAKEFAMMAAQADEYDIQAGRTAAVQAVDARVRAFARQMVEDHSRTQAVLRQAATASGLEPPPPGMGGDQSRLLYALQALTGPDFDRTYMRQQVLAHDQALAVAQSYAAQGRDANLRAAAQTDAPLVQHHLDMAMQLRASLGGA